MAMKMMLCNTFFFSLRNPIEPISMAGRNKDILNNQKLILEANGDEKVEADKQMPFDYVLELKKLLGSSAKNVKSGCDFGRRGWWVMRRGGGWWVVVSQQQREIKGEGERVWVVVEMGLWRPTNLFKYALI
ncbi:unnamed protein product [Prunus armeniaca]|uniref:Uncharacterized protein n=1 Tax=Prunus armeniaca TaxID=36596 RepID=A0A6J5XYL0_PRUAR|nr:unnamed protein product [Prunus armeniaca]